MNILGLGAALMIATAAQAQAIRVGGFNFDRGGSHGVISGGWAWAGFTADFGTLFQPAEFHETLELTPAFLNGVDLLLITAVQEGGNVQIQPLSTDEQQALESWVQGGGRAVILADNSTGYFLASQSILAPFGMSSTGIINGMLTGGVTASPPSCSPVEGPFGSITLVQGGWVSWFDSIGSATVLAGWGAEMPSLAQLQFGAGRVILATDSSMFVEPLIVGVPSNELRRNAMLWLGVRPATQPGDVGCGGGSGVTLSLPFPPGPGDTYRWFRDGLLIPGETSPELVLPWSGAPGGNYHAVVTNACHPGGLASTPLSITACGADLTCDGAVDFNDYLEFLNLYNASDLRVDFNADGSVDFNDYLEFLNLYNQGC